MALNSFGKDRCARLLRTNCFFGSTRWPPLARCEDIRCPSGHFMRHKQVLGYSSASHEAHRGGHRGERSASWPSHANPSPYDIFAIGRNTPYSKSRFYELVKLYHPDRHRHGPPASSHDGLTSEIRLERYRLVILANDILSDPEKRRAYDTHGLGWLSSHRDINDLYRTVDRSWRERPGSAARNATWEDWERWYAERYGTVKESQRPVFMSNMQFAALILATIAVVSAMQASRAGENAAHVRDRTAAQDIAAREAMWQKGRSTSGKGREERIEMFVRERENWTHGFAPHKYEGQGRSRNQK